MENWKEDISGNYIDLINGFAFKSKNFIKEQVKNSLPVIKIKNVANGDVNLDDVDYHLINESLEKYIISKGDVLIAMTGNHPQSNSQVVGDVSKYKLSTSALLNQRVGKIVSNEKSDLNFIYYLFKNKDTHTYLANQSSGSANQANISKTSILDLELSFPPLAEQKAIAEVLSSLDDKIDLLHRQNETLEEIAQNLFRQWFVEEAEDSWEEVYLDDVLSVLGGSTPSTRNPDYWNGNINWTSPRDITNLNSIYLFDTPRKITEKGLKKISSGLLPEGTLLMTSRAPVGVLAFAETPLAINQGYIAIIDDKGFSKEFLYLWLKENMEYVHSFANGSTFLEISRSVFKTLRFIVPPKEKIEKFQNSIKTKFDKIKSNQIQIQTLEKLRDTLLPKLMSGEVRVKM